jgi:DNA-binding PadR family transcriptional regulator
MQLSNAETAILGLLSEEPMHPYRVEQEVKYRDMRFWTELSMSSIYKLLRKLENSGLVSSKKEISTENRVQKTYMLTPGGSDALGKKIESLISKTEHIRWQVDIGIYNCDLLSRKKTRKALSSYRADLKEKIAGYRNLLKFLKSIKCPPHRFELAKRPIHLLKAEIEWVDSFMETLK